LAVHIRLKRMGAKKRPFYRIVAADSRRARDGRFLETLGTYNPITKPAAVSVHEDKLTKWLNEGAIPSDTVRSLLTQIGFTEKYEKASKGEDVSEIALKEHIHERKKKTRKMKKATLAAASVEAAEEPAAEEAAEAEVAADAEPEKTEEEKEEGAE
jgi:small subunit ribosomal protein S16